MKKTAKKIFGSEDGQSLVMFALLFAVLAGCVALSLDLGQAYLTQVNLQNAADLAAIAGAQDLPSSGSSIRTAVECAGLNGAENADTVVTTPYSGDANKIEVVCSQEISYSFARILGYTDKTVTARAVAAKSNTARAFDFAVFSGDPGYPLNFYGGLMKVAGDIHTNNALTINGNEQKIEGSAEAAGAFTMYGSDELISGYCQASSITAQGQNIYIGERITSPAPQIDMPDFSELIKEEAQKAGNIYYGNVDYNGCQINVNSPIYIEGNLTVNGDSFNGNGVILVSGNITFNGSNTSSSGGTVCFYSREGSITVNGDASHLDGLLYAPCGSVAFNGSRQVVTGGIVANRIYINGSELTVNYRRADSSLIGKSSVALVE